MQPSKTYSNRSSRPPRLHLHSRNVRSSRYAEPATSPDTSRTVKAGYPPHPLTIVPELPIDSLGLKQGEQLVVTQRPSAGHQAFQSARSSPFPAPRPAAAMTGLTASQVRDTPTPTARPGGKGGLPDHVPTSNGYLMHRVSGRTRMSDVWAEVTARDC